MPNKLAALWHRLRAAMTAAWHAFNCKSPESLQHYIDAEQLRATSNTPASTSLGPTNASTGGTESAYIGIVDRHGTTLLGGTAKIDDLAKLPLEAIAIGAFGLLALAIVLAHEPRGPQLIVKNNKRKGWTPHILPGGKQDV